MSDETSECSTRIGEYGIEFRVGPHVKIGDDCSFGNKFRAEEYAQLGDRVRVDDNVRVRPFGCVPNDAKLSKNLIVPKYGTVQLQGNRVKVMVAKPAPPDSIYVINRDTGLCDKKKRDAYLK